MTPSWWGADDVIASVSGIHTKTHRPVFITNPGTHCKVRFRQPSGRSVQTHQNYAFSPEHVTCGWCLSLPVDVQ